MQEMQVWHSSSSLEEGNGNPLHYSPLENHRGREDWRAVVLGDTNKLDTTQQLTNKKQQLPNTHKHSLQVQVRWSDQHLQCAFSFSCFHADQMFWGQFLYVSEHIGICSKYAPLSMGFLKNTREGCHFLLQKIFLTQGLNPGLLHWGGFLTDWTTLALFKDTEITFTGTFVSGHFYSRSG